MADNIIPFPKRAHNDDDDGGSLPPSPTAALMFAFAYRRLGGTFAICSRGERFMGRAEPCLYRFEGVPLPQMHGAAPHERFHDPKEWQGAMKLLEVLLHRLDPSDSGMIYDLMANAAVDDRKLVPSIEEPTRLAA